MTHVFSLEAMAACEQRGHAFAWVRTWHDVGFDECTRCGLTRPGGAEEPAAGIMPGATVEQPLSVAPPSHEEPAAAATHYADATDAANQRRRGRPANIDRDGEIRWRRGNGESPKSLAKEFGVSLCRIYQITSNSKGEA